MLFIYNILTYIISFFLKIIALFNKKIQLFVRGRKTVFSSLKHSISKTDKTIWVHTASLGEFEQGLPIIEKLKLQYPTHKIVVSFFSPSGYEVKKNSAIADCMVYLPLDTKINAKRFVKAIHPELVIFVKYEFWPNYLNELKKQNIPTLLVSGIFREKQLFFKSYGNWMRNSLAAFTHFFVQNEKSKNLLNNIGVSNCTITGDTRYDRVFEILERDNRLDFIEEFKQDTSTIVYGSSWEDDEAIYLDFLNDSKGIKHIIAPHNIKDSKIEKLLNSISKKTVLYSDIANKNLAEFDVLIINTIGLLTKVYSYADIAYVGGAFKTGLHNVLEPAVFGIPVVIGPKYQKFQEATDLVERKGVLSVPSKKEYELTINQLINNADYRKQTGSINSTFIQQQAGATEKIIDYISTSL